MLKDDSKRPRSRISGNAAPRAVARTTVCCVFLLTQFVLGLLPAAALEIRWALSSNRIYVTGPGTATLTQIKAAQRQAPLERVTNGVWHLRANLIVEEGAKLELHGTGIGGDVDQLRLQSNNSQGTNQFVIINADWGSISIRSTSITSWDDAVNGPDVEYATFGRAFIGVRSELAADGVTPLESRMDIFDSDIGYLGYDSSEGYGLSWKVIGRQPGLFDLVNVLGDIQNSHIHHNYFGVYTFGAYGMQWLNNEVAYNIQYGFDPHDDSDHLLIQGNNVHHNGNHGIIASMRCDHLTIRSNTCWANAQNGIILHRSSDDCLIEQNQCFDNDDTGVVLAGSARCIVRSNLLVRNFEAAVRVSLGSADNLIEANECASNTWYGFYLYKGADLPEPNDDGRPKRNRFVANLVHGNAKEAINLADADDNRFATNVFSANGDRLFFVRGFRNRLDGNDIPTNVIIRTEGSPVNAASTYIANQASSRVQVDANSSTIFQDGNGRIFDTEENGVPTAVTTNGSTLVLGAAEIGTASTVIARQFWVSAPEGTVFVDPIDWTNSGPSGRKWAVRADPPQQSIHFTVGDLGNNANHTVLKKGSPLMTVRSDSTGTIQFTDVIATTNDIVYAIDAGVTNSIEVQAAAERRSDGLAVSWTGGTLQRATTLSPPDWQDVPITNGQVELQINTTEPMELFRVSTVGQLDPARPPSGNFDLSHWKLTLPDADSTEIPAAQLMVGFTNSFFFTAADGAMVFSCPVAGGTTPGSAYPRCELRELLLPSNEAVNWTGFGTHILNAQCRVMQLPSTRKTIIGQIHSFGGNAYPLVKLQFNSGKVEALVKTSPNSPADTSLPFANIALGTRIDYQLKVVDGLLSMTVNGINQSVNVFQTDPAWTNQTFYFKAGNYCQDNSGTANEGAVVSFHRLSVEHSHE